MPTDYDLSLRGVTKFFAPSTTAVKDVSFDVSPGTFTILLGLTV